jgi:hypothetical protein
MGSGLEVYNADGTLQFDGTVPLAFRVGTFTATVGGGSLSLGNIGNNEVWFQRYAPDQLKAPNVYVGVSGSNTIIYWQDGPLATTDPCFVIYGLY